MSYDLKERTKVYAVDIWKLCSNFPHTREYSNYVNQLLRCSSSVAANFRASKRAKSPADFVYKLKIVEEEADESLFFLELLLTINSNQELTDEIERLIKESNELLAIVVSSIKTAKANNSR
jgi:four helix bundle protein